MEGIEDDERERRDRIIDRILLEYPFRRVADAGRNYARRFASIPTDDLEQIVDAILDRHDGKFAPPPRVFVRHWQSIREGRYGNGARDVLGGPDHRGGRFMTVPELNAEYASLPDWAFTDEPFKAEPGELFKAFKARRWASHATRIYARAVAKALRIHDPYFKPRELTSFSRLGVEQGEERSDDVLQV